MVNYMGNWHLIAFCHLRNDWRDFVLGRMTLSIVEGTAFKIRDKEEWEPFLHPLCQDSCRLPSEFLC